MDLESSAELLERYRQGDERAAEQLFAQYVGRLTALARARLSPKLSARTDPEDVVLSAYRSFFVAAREGRFALARSGDLWRLLVAITLHKLYRQVRRHEAASRSVHLESFDIDSELLSQEPSPEEVIGVAEELENLFGRLNPFARRVLELRLQDRTLASIAEMTGRSERTVRRTLTEIREMLAPRFTKKVLQGI